MPFTNPNEEYKKELELKDGTKLKVWIQIIDYSEEDTNVSVHIYSSNGRRTIGVIHLLPDYSKLKGCARIVNNIIADENLRNKGLGKMMLKILIDYISRKHPDVKTIDGMLTEEDLSNTPYLENFYKHNGFNVRISANRKYGCVKKDL